VGVDGRGLLIGLAGIGDIVWSSELAAPGELGIEGWNLEVAPKEVHPTKYISAHTVILEISSIKLPSGSCYILLH
jgi:hypothetical protein